MHISNHKHIISSSYALTFMHIPQNNPNLCKHTLPSHIHTNYPAILRQTHTQHPPTLPHTYSCANHPLNHTYIPLAYICTNILVHHPSIHTHVPIYLYPHYPLSQLFHIIYSHGKIPILPLHPYARTLPHTLTHAHAYIYTFYSLPHSRYLDIYAIHVLYGAAGCIQPPG